MAINKVINDATKKYEPVTTETVVFDTVPTVNSFNAVTSDGVARAISGASGEVPAVTENDNGKILTAVYDAGGPAVEWGTAPSTTPDVEAPLYVNPDDEVALRFGSGLTLEESESTENDTLAVALSGTGGLYYDDMESNALAVQLAPDGGLENVIDDGEQVGLRVTNPLPASLGTAGQVLTVNSGATGVEWSALTTSVTDIQQVAALPASPVSSVLYLIPET